MDIVDYHKGLVVLVKEDDQAEENNGNWVEKFHIGSLEHFLK